MIVVDSSVWIAHLRVSQTSGVRKLQSIEKTDDIVVGDLILLEVLQGAVDERDASRIERNLREFRIERMFDDGVAVKAARNYRLLRRHGITVRKTIDMIIATFCIERGYGLLHEDRDFDPMSTHLGLQTV